MQVAVTGVTGYLGTAIARRLVRDGHSIVGLVRAESPTERVEGIVERLVVGDQADASCWPDLLQSTDCIIHNSLDWSMMRTDPPDHLACLQSNLEASVLLMEASRPRQFVFISTMAVYSQAFPGVASIADSGELDESAVLRPATEYGAYKAAVESYLWAEHLRYNRNTVALRPCMVYGIDRKLDRSRGYDVVDQLKRTGAYSSHDQGHFVHIDDVTAAVAAVVGNESASGRAYNLVDCHASLGDLAHMAAEIMGLDARIEDAVAGQPHHDFSKQAVRSLGVNPDRGHAGLRDHLEELIAIMDASDAV